jgi:hypothetical protein
MAKSSTRKLKTIGLLSDLDAPLKSQPIKPHDNRQPQLAFDPMPARIQPALALLVKKPPSGDQWTYEVKMGWLSACRSFGTKPCPDYHPWWPRLDIIFPSHSRSSEGSRSRYHGPRW